MKKLNQRVQSLRIQIPLPLPSSGDAAGHRMAEIEAEQALVSANSESSRADGATHPRRHRASLGRRTFYWVNRNRTRARPEGVTDVQANRRRWSVRAGVG